MDERSFECSRCGMAVPTGADRCPSCRARRRQAPVSTSAGAKTGPQAAAAWEAQAWQSHDGDAEHRRARAAVLGDAHAARAVAPGATLACTALRVVALAAIAAAAVQATRLVLVVSVVDPVELTSSKAWQVAGDLADVVLAVTAAATMVATVLVIGWAAVAERNVRAMAIDTSRWGPSIRRAVLQVAVATVLALGWAWVPGGPAQSDRVAELGLAFASMVALSLAASTTNRLLLAISARELQQEEILLRIEAASVQRPRSRPSVL